MSKARVLVAEDDAHVAELVAWALEPLDLEVVPARSGDDALASIAASRPAVAILDLGLPGRSGLEVLERLRAAPDTAGLPVLVLSARDGALREAVEGLGASFMSKPFDVDALAARVGALLKLPGGQA